MTTWANRTLAELKRVERARLAVHTSDHHWTFAGKLGKLPLKQRLRAYKIIVSHDSYVVHSAKTCHCPKVIARHLRERRHARAHIRKIDAKLHPVFTYPWWWGPLGACESGNDPGYSDGLYEGWINFLNSTWLYYGGGQFAAHAYDATEYEQYVVTMRMHADVPWSQSNPACSAQIGM